MTHVKIGAIESAAYVTTKTFVETIAEQKSVLVVRLKSSKYFPADKPLDKHVLYKVNQQIIGFGVFTYFFHGDMVIGLQYKYTAKRVSSKVQKVGEIVHYFPE